MGLGYGSEFQLMRFLGHHREELDLLIQNATGVFAPVHWFDYPYDNKRKSGDGEFTGIECFRNLPNYEEIQKEWEEFWPQGGSSMNWDGIFIQDGVWYFVEAKANKKEAYQHCRAKGLESKRKIDQAMEFAKEEWFKVSNKIKWRRTSCYQLANRLAFAAFCNLKCHIPVKILYISFLNGYYDNSVESNKDWEVIWRNEYEILGLSESDLQGVLFHIYPNCKKEVQK